MKNVEERREIKIKAPQFLLSIRVFGMYTCNSHFQSQNQSHLHDTPLQF
jgi:hypothetical protein